MPGWYLRKSSSHSFCRVAIPSLPHTVSVPETCATGSYFGKAAKSWAQAEAADKIVASEIAAVSFILLIPLWVCVCVKHSGLFELLELFTRHFRRQRKIAAVLKDVFLSLAAEDVRQKSLELRLNWPTGRTIDVDVDRLDQRISTVLHVLFGRFNERAIRIVCERERLHLSALARALRCRVRDPVGIFRERIDDNLAALRRTGPGFEQHTYFVEGDFVELGFHISPPWKAIRCMERQKLLALRS